MIGLPAVFLSVFQGGKDSLSTGLSVQLTYKIVCAFNERQLSPANTVASVGWLSSRVNYVVSQTIHKRIRKAIVNSSSRRRVTGEEARLLLNRISRRYRITSKTLKVRRVWISFLFYFCAAQVVKVMRAHRPTRKKKQTVQHPASEYVCQMC